ncbi:protoporphyrinogen/coproporphyrinogen oxidase [Pseudonocardia spinosispora]|uniref:protoporphyrinogen/coproporphyrinogen oxidase n=1 Tax=Pseudonocardia spinosispora TaxID=103441 RepID=UPI0004041E0B|nr:FAD-dependent oxidoreductase [Pseudonocardia spinosispora]
MKIAIIGAGVAGAAAAHTLRRNGAHPIVLEASDAVGGRTRTVDHDKFALDSGAIFVMGSYARTLHYLRESGHRPDMRRWVARTAVLDDSGARHSVRFDLPWTLLRMPQLGWRDRARLALGVAGLLLRRASSPFDIDDLAALDDGRSLAEWATDSFGERVYEYVVRPLMEPLTGADATAISAAFTIALLSQPTRTRLTVPNGGLGRIASWLLDGVDVRLSTPALSLHTGPAGVTVETTDGPLAVDAVVMATDVRRARSLLDGVVDRAVLGALDAVVPIPAYHVLLGYQTDPWPDARQDLVVHAGPGLHHNYGVLLNSRRAAGSTPEGGQTVSVYFDRAQAPADDEKQVVDLAREAVDTAFGPAVPDFHQVFDMDVALIAPVPGHYRRMRAARDLMPDDIRLAGDFLTHSGIESALRSGEQAARDLLARKR